MDKNELKSKNKNPKKRIVLHSCSKIFMSQRQDARQTFQKPTLFFHSITYHTLLHPYSPWPTFIKSLALRGHRMNNEAGQRGLLLYILWDLGSQMANLVSTRGKLIPTYFFFPLSECGHPVLCWINTPRGALSAHEQQWGHCTITYGFCLFGETYFHQFLFIFICWFKLIQTLEKVKNWILRK